jgi:hypothetical protein
LCYLVDFDLYNTIILLDMIIFEGRGFLKEMRGKEENEGERGKI